MKILDQGLFCFIPEFALSFLTKHNLFSPQKELDYRPSFCQYLIIYEEENTSFWRPCTRTIEVIWQHFS
jgi:hypothetical protein